MSSLLKLENITKVFNTDECPPIENLALEIKSGDFVSVEGPSGTGKSTLLYIMGGLIKPTSGQIIFANQDITTLGTTALGAWRKNNIGFIFQETVLFQALTAKENLVEAICMKEKTNKKTINNLADSYLHQFGLTEKSNHLPWELSIGQRRRLVAARALMSNAPIILADEPTNDLDDFWAEKTVTLLQKKAKAGAAVLLVTHNKQWAKYAQKRMVLNQGKLQSFTDTI